MTHEEYTAKQSFIDKHCPRIKNCCDGKGLYGEKDISTEKVNVHIQSIQIIKTKDKGD